MRRKPHTTRRSVLTATGALSLLGIAGITSGSSSSALANAPVPDDADARTYPTMGTNGDAPTATIYGNFKCPVTQGFVFRNLESIIEEFVVTGRLNLEFYNLTYDPGTTSSYFISDSDPRIAAIGLAVWDEDPDSYWQFYHDTFADMPSGYVDYDELASRVRSADVSNVDALVDRAEDGEYDAEVEQISASAAADGVTFTPQLAFAGETTAPHHGTRSILDWIEARLEDAPAETDGDGESDAEDEEFEEPEEDVEAEESEADAEDEEPGTETEDGEDGGSDAETEESSDGESEGSDAETETEPEGGAEDEQPEDDVSDAGDAESETEPEAEPDAESDETTESDDTGEPSDESPEITGKTEIDDCPYE